MSSDVDQNGPPFDGSERSGRAREVPARSGIGPVEAPITVAVLAVDHISEADRFAYWREQWCQGTAGVTGELAPVERRGFYARATAWTAPCVIRLRLETGPFRVSRGPLEISRHSLENWICLYQEMSDGATVQHAGNEFTTRPGDLLLTDPTIPFSSRPRSVHDYRRWMLPRAWIEPHLPSGRRPLSAQLAGSHGINGLVQAYLHALNDAIDECDSAELPGNHRQLLPPSRVGLRRRSWRPTHRNPGGQTATGEGLYSAPSVGAGFDPGKDGRRDEDLCSATASPLRADRDQLCGACAGQAAGRMPRDTGEPIEQSPVHHRHRLHLGFQQPRVVLSGFPQALRRQSGHGASRLICRTAASSSPSRRLNAPLACATAAIQQAPGYGAR